MRLSVAMLISVIPMAAAAAEGDRSAPEMRVLEDTQDFQLGGATTRSAVVPEAIVLDEATPRARLSTPLPTQTSITTQRQTTLGPATLFVGEGLNSGREAVEMGTFLRSGQARAGVSVTYLEEQAQLSRSEIFVDYALTERFSVGLSGILNSELDANETVPQVGLSAEYSSESGAFLQGGFAGAAEYDPVIGVSIGLRF